MVETAAALAERVASSGIPGRAAAAKVCALSKGVAVPKGVFSISLNQCASIKSTTYDNPPGCFTAAQFARMAMCIAIHALIPRRAGIFSRFVTLFVTFLSW